MQQPHHILDAASVATQFSISSRLDEVYPDDDCSYFLLKESIHSLTNHKKNNHLKPIDDNASLDSVNSDDLMLKKFEQFETEFLDKKTIVVNKTNWEHLGHNAVFAEPAFFSENENSDALFHLLMLKAQKQREKVSFKIIPSDLFMNDVQHLLVCFINKKYVFLKSNPLSNFRWA